MAWISNPIGNIQNYCRTCLCDMSKKICYDIFIETEEARCIRNVLTSCMSKELKFNNSLPKMLCELCYNLIMNFNTFKTNAEKVEEYLQNYLHTCQIILEKKSEVKDECYDNQEYPVLLYVYNNTLNENDGSVSDAQEEIPYHMLEVSKKENTNKEKVNETKPKLKHSKTKELKPHICNICNQSFTYRKNLAKHLLSHHENPNDSEKTLSYECEGCDKKFKSLNSLNAHKRTHAEKDRVLMCSVCKKVFKKVSHLKRHELSHREKTYRCTSCVRSFADENGLNNHIKLHNNVYPHVCLLCKKRFVTISRLQDHLKTHIKDNTFLCNYCGKKFGSKGNLNQHVNRHTKNRLFPCDKCPKKFVTKGGLKSHLVKHSSERTYKCELCEAKFARRHCLLRHKLRHIGIKPYNCPSCSKGFVSKYHLIRHFRIHSGEKPYQCDVCERKFAQKGDLSRHRRLHTGDKYHKCAQCSQTFRLKSDLLQHMSDHYNASQPAVEELTNCDPKTTLVREASDKSFIMEELPNLNP